MITGLDIEALEQSSYWETEETDKGCTGIRAFLFSYDQMYGDLAAHTVALPSIGDPFSPVDTEPWNRCWLREMRCEKYGMDEDKTLIICSYSNAPWDRVSATYGDTPPLDYTGQADGDYILEWLLPMDISVSGDFWDVGKDSSWVWEGTSPPEGVMQSIWLIIKTNEIHCTRVVGRSPIDVDTYMNTMQGLTGKICNKDNNYDNPFNCDKNTLLFNGGNARPYIDHAGIKMWEIDLSFGIRDVESESSIEDKGGWNMIPRIKSGTALYDMPLRGTDTIYIGADLRALFKYK